MMESKLLFTVLVQSVERKSMVMESMHLRHKTSIALLQKLHRAALSFIK